MTTPLISIALVTRNRERSLDRTLRSLRSQLTQPWELVVSDDSDPSSAIETRVVCERYGARYIKGPRRGLYANRNFCARACGGSHIRTMDDDHEFPVNHIARCAEAVSTDQDAIWCVGERIISNGKLAREVTYPGQLNARGFAVTPKDPSDSWAIADGAAIYPRTIFDRVQFCEDFKFGAAFLEFGSRLKWLGYRIRRVETSYIIHHYDANARSFMDESLELSSRTFAMLCHSLIYQQSLRNKALTSYELVKAFCASPFRSIDAIASGRRAFIKRRGEP